MALRQLACRGLLAARSTQGVTVTVTRLSSSAAITPADTHTGMTLEKKLSMYPKLGNREIVGPGINGNPDYVDMTNFPMPAVRFREDTPEILALREKEKADWKTLTIDEKKTLYRASFCQTMAEMTAPTGEWRSVWAGVLWGFAITGWILIWLKLYVLPAIPGTISYEWRVAMVERMLQQRAGAIEGVSSKWDYEKGQWK